MPRVFILLQSKRRLMRLLPSKPRRMLKKRHLPIRRPSLKLGLRLKLKVRNFTISFISV